MLKILTLEKKDISGIIEGLKSEKKEVQRYFFKQYQKKIMAICLRYLKDEDEALDGMNQTFLKIFEKIKTFKTEGSFDFWVKRITVNTCIDIIRSQKAYKKMFIQPGEFSEYGEPVEETDISDDIWKQACEIPAECVMSMIQQLPPASRAVFNLYAIDGYTHPQIAEHLKISTGTSKWHLNNARAILKEKILHYLLQNRIDYGKQEAEK
jgi:RNA polymerase sigma-70 factor (ECF subfamily)